MGSEEDGTRKKMAGNGGGERRAGRSLPGPLPPMLHITASRPHGELLIGLREASMLVSVF
jgi:hypothetical protein